MNVIFWSVSALIQCLLVYPFNVQQADFALPKNGQRLIGKEIKIKHVISTSFCANDCVRLDECLAYNYDETNGICQLMESNDLSEVEPDPNYQIVLKKVKCDIQPCFYNAACRDMPTPVHDDRGFRCACPCGRCGKRCERLHFGLIENACIMFYNAGYKKVESPEECMSFCWDTQGCKSADYNNDRGTCWLNSVTHDEEEIDPNCYIHYAGVAYLFFNCTCDE